MEQASGLWSRLKESWAAEPEEDEEQGFFASTRQQLDEATTLNRTQRFYGFLVCFGMSSLFTLLSLFAFFPIFHPTKFATMYTFGNIFAVASTMFLMGPMAQVKRMFDQGRWVATAVYIGSLVLTLAAAFVTGNGLLVLVCLVFQMGALAWYCLSYIPFARSLVGGMFTRFAGDG